MTAAPADFPVVHAVTDDEIVAAPDFVARALSVMRALGPRGAVHLRAPRLAARRLCEIADTLAGAQAGTGAWVIVNDRVDIAMTAGARGAQLTSRSLSVPDARLAAPDLPLGASVHGIAEAAASERDGARWLVAGHVFTTPSHPGDAGRGEAFVRALAAASTVPVVAIGGLRPEHAPAIRSLGVMGIAAIRGIWASEDASGSAIAYLLSYDGGGTA
ncbi:MAG: hypothetical protein NVS1B4_00130 [Gemmatimonadaceae bacterium]